MFPIHQVLLYPGTSKPLQIFEPRYIKMIQDSLAERVPIAIGNLPEENQELSYQKSGKIEFVRDVVGYGMPQVIEHRPDGTLLILLPGQGKARLTQVQDESRPYLVMLAEKISENLDVSDDSLKRYLTLEKLLLSWLEQNIEDPRARDEFRRHLKSPDQVIGCVAAYLLRDPDLQQEVLEANTMDRKIEIISGIIGPGV